MTSVESTDSNGVEVDGVRFEILVPERVWVIPAHQLEAATPLKIGIRITNNTQNSIQLPWFDPLTNLILEIWELNGKPLQRQGARGLLLNSLQLVCPLVMPRQSVTFFLNFKLLWQDGKLLLQGYDEVGSGWYFDDLKLGSYQARFNYISSRAAMLCDDPVTMESRMARSLWIGQVVTPFLKFRLVQP